MTAEETASLMGISRATWERAYHQGKTPDPVEWTNSRYWNRMEIEAWMKACCPPRIDWQRKASKP